MRWWIIVLVFLAAALNYIDRQTLSLLAPTIQKDLSMDDRDYANVLNVFLIAYTIAYLVSGKLVDKMGTRNSTLLFVIWWSISNMLTAWVHGIKSMNVARFSLGLGEAGIWPAASKIVSEWFPSKERAFAIGLYTMGSTIGATIAPSMLNALVSYNYAEKLPLAMTLFAQGTGWRMAFLLSGLAGLLWVIPWMILYRKPRENSFVTEEEIKHIDDADNSSTTVDEPAWKWRQILTYKPLWLLLFARLLTDPVWFFYQSWFTKYLTAERGLSQAQTSITWMVYAAAGAGSLVGGWLSGVLIKRGMSPVKARMLMMLATALLMPLSPFIAKVAGISTTMAVTAVVVFATLSWLINITALIVDCSPKHSVGSIFSIVAAGSTLGAIIMNMIVANMVSGPSSKPLGFLDQAFKAIIGPLLDTISGKGYSAWFLVMAFLHPAALLLLWLGGINRKQAVA